MQALIKDMFALTQIDQVDRVLVPVDITEIVKEVVADLEARLVETGGRVEIGADLPIVPGDPAQIRQLLQNLIGNALKFHRKDVVPVVKVTAPYSAWARIDVADNGVGFDEQYLSEIFTPFHRLHGRGEFEGSGIGLAICKKIVEWHGGTITARSSPECGATFEVDFPIISTLKR
jgi:signal transduction histidine kinase